MVTKLLSIYKYLCKWLSENLSSKQTADLDSKINDQDKINFGSLCTCDSTGSTELEYIPLLWFFVGPGSIRYRVLNPKITPN